MAIFVSVAIKSFQNQTAQYQNVQQKLETHEFYANKEQCEHR